MIRVPTPSLLAALWMGRFWPNAILALICAGVILFCLSPWLMLAGIQMPWMPDGDVNFWWLLFGTFILVPLGASLPPLVVNAWSDWRTARTISRARRLFYGLKQEKSGKIHALLRVISPDGQPQVFEYESSLAHAMPKDTYQQARDAFIDLRDLPPAESQRMQLFGKRARKIVDLLERQKRDALLLESDETMIDKMERDYLFFISRLSRIQATVFPAEQNLKAPSSLPSPPARSSLKDDERTAIQAARKAQMEHRDRLREEVSQELLSMEERLAFIHDALSLHGHPEVINERLYLPSPLMAELQALSWENL